MPARKKHHRGMAHATADTVRTALKLAGLVFGVILLVCTLGALVIEWNRSSEVRRCLSIDRFNIRPKHPVLPSNTQHEPTAWGYFTLDKQQGFVRWSLKESYSGASSLFTPIGFEIRGPINVSSPDTAPVFIQLGEGDRHPFLDYRVSGSAYVDLAQVHALNSDPASYYFSLFVGVGSERREMGRSSLSAIC